MRSHRRLVLALSCIVLSAVTGSSLPAQEKKIGRKDVPAAVLAAFAKSYPHARIRGTSSEVENGTTYFEIESMDGAQARDILYLADGTAWEVEETVAPRGLPAPVKAVVGKEFPKAKIAKAEKVAKGDAVSFEVHVSLGAKTGSIVVDQAGKVLEKKDLDAKKKKGAKEDDEKEEEDD